ncbi:MAG: helix-turn-helix domain-containing protein [Armatimonadia bacterium]
MTQKQIGEITGWSKTTICKAFKSLTSTGFIERVEIRGSIYYRVVGFRKWNDGTRYQRQSEQPQASNGQPEAKSEQQEYQTEQPGNISMVACGSPAGLGSDAARPPESQCRAAVGAHQGMLPRSRLSPPGWQPRETLDEKEIKKEDREQSRLQNCSSDSSLSASSRQTTNGHETKIASTEGSPDQWGPSAFTVEYIRQTATGRERTKTTVEGLTPEEEEAFRLLFAFGIKTPVAIKLAESYPLARIASAVEALQSAHKNINQFTMCRHLRTVSEDSAGGIRRSSRPSTLQKAN